MKDASFCGAPRLAGIFFCLAVVGMPVVIPAAESGGGEGRESRTSGDGFFKNSIGMEMVRMTEGYWVGKYEVTQEEYEKVTGTNPSRYKGARKPVEEVSWHDAMAFCKKLTELERPMGALPKGHAYTLPTDQQWIAFVADATLKQAVYGRFGPKQESLGPLEVGSLGANKFGLHDVRGNVWEWCLEKYLPGYAWHVLRGGAWSIADPEGLDISIRLNVEPETRYPFYGFRCVLTAEKSPE
ncbi:MAG: SUMF1/EgtB/PvdO family nonheme iron enzyme [Verrucomicrobia bacterium]|nr:SUMF1/EgtB/PvdO family nonheme iron enzyme [Verrucomicrobiota bacterium]